jgi:hypothetical protein
MPTTETPFLIFWRALDAELAKIGEKPATQGEAGSYWSAGRWWPSRPGLAAKDMHARFYAAKTREAAR